MGVGERGWGDTFLLVYFSVTFTVCRGKVGSLYYFSDLQSFDLAMQDSHLSLYYTKTWYQLYISDPLW